MIDPLTFRSPLDDLPDEPTFRRDLQRVTLGPMILLGVAVVALLGLVIFLLQSARVVERIDLRLGEVLAVEKLAVDMETGVRGFQLTNDERFLEPWETAQQRLESALADLRRERPGVAPTPRETERLETAARQWSAWAVQTVQLRREGVTGTDVAFELDGKALMDAVREASYLYINKLARERGERVSLLRQLEIGVTVAVAGGGVLCGLAAVLWLRRLMHNVRVAYRRSLTAAARQIEELRVLLESIGDAVIATDTAGRIMFLNPVAEKLTGWSSTEARGQPMAEVFVISNEETGAPAENPAVRVLREGVVVGLANHTVLQSRDGRSWPIEDSAAPIRSGEGELRGVILVFHDVSERRAQERRLLESEERLRFLNELAEATRTLADPGAIMSVVTRLTVEFLGASRCNYAEIEADGEHFTIPQDYSVGCATTVGSYQLSDFGAGVAETLRAGGALIVDDVRQAMAGDPGLAGFDALQIRAYICYPLLKAGKLRTLMAVHQTTPRRWTEAEVSLLKEAVERSWAYIERVRAETELRASEERGRLALQAAALGTWDFIPATRELRWDARCKELFGLPPEAAVDFSVFLAGLHPDDRSAANQAVDAAFDPRGGGGFTMIYRTVGLQDGGRLRWIRSMGQALFDERGVVQRFIGTVLDVTEARQNEESLRAAKEQAESASRAKDNFLAALSHELRTPLTPVLLTTAALRADPSLSPEMRADLAAVQRNVELEARLIDDLLDLTRIARGKLALRPQACDVHSLIGLAAGIVSEESRVKGQTMHLELAAEHSQLTADPARLQQLFWNLLRNAVKFTPTGGSITVRTRDSRDGLLAEVSDSGIGLAAGSFERIFQPFEQVGYENDHRFGGLGLGLAIARAIVDLHGGTIRAESAGPGQGATFIVEFPLSQVMAAAAPGSNGKHNGAENSPASASGQTYRLLVVEDHASTLEVLARLLRKAGHEVTTATDVRSALAAAAAGRFDGVVSDLGLPDGTGVALMEMLRDRHGLRGIALTGYGMDEDLRRTHEAGFLLHLIKPIDFEALRQALTVFRQPDGA